MAQEPNAAGSIEANIEGEITGQVAVGTHILQIGSVHGGVVNVAMPGQQPVPRARPTPVQLRPRPFAGLLDRKEETAASASALGATQSTEIYGAAGVGKTVLLRQLSYTVAMKPFPDGVIYRELHTEPSDDVLQLLWNDFYECEVPFKPTDSQLRRTLQDKQALIILDRVEFSRDDLEQVMNVAAAATFLLGSRERHLWGEARVLQLRGLPEEDLRALAEREMGHALSYSETAVVHELVTTLAGNPLQILQALSAARIDDRPLSEAAEAALPNEAAKCSSRPEPHRRVLGALALLSGAPVQASTLGELAHVERIDKVLGGLEERHLVSSSRGTYRLADDAAELLPSETEQTDFKRRAVQHFATSSQSQRSRAEAIIDQLPVLTRALSWSASLGWSREAMQLMRALEEPLLASGRWGAWSEALRFGEQAAAAGGDKAACGWVLHQSGTLALCSDDATQAKESLQQALRIRESLGDKPGADVTRHNLGLLLPAGVGPPEKAPPRDRVITKKALFRGVTVLCGIVATVLLMAKYWNPMSDSGVLSPSPLPSLTPTFSSATPTPSPTATSTPTVTPTLTVTFTPTTTTSPTTTPTETPAPPASAVVSSLNLSPNPIEWGSASKGTVTLNEPASADNITVLLASDPPNVLSIPKAIPIAAGKNQGTFEIRTSMPDSRMPADAVMITASLGGVNGKSARLQLRQPPAAQIEYTGDKKITKGEQATLTYRLANAMDASIYPPIGKVNLSGGEITVSPARTTAYTLTAANRAGKKVQKRVTITVSEPEPRPEKVSLRLDLNPTSVLVGSNSRGTLVVSGINGGSPIRVSLSTSNPRLARISKGSAVEVLPGRPRMFDVLTGSPVVARRASWVEQQVRVIATAPGARLAEAVLTIRSAPRKPPPGTVPSVPKPGHRPLPPPPYGTRPDRRVIIPTPTPTLPPR